MNGCAASLGSKVEALRQVFDEGFSSPIRPFEAKPEQFLAIRSAGEPLALRVADLSRLEPRREIVPLPAENGDLLGLAGIQGRLVPVYCLASLMGLGADSTGWRWIAVCGLEDPFGLAFESLDACFSVPPTSILERSGDNLARGLGKQAVRFADGVRNVVPVRALETALRNSVSAGPSAIKESSS
jgi:chemotaxis signal transduction protein